MDLEGVAKILECIICLERFTEPVTLDCGHCFCKRCVLQVQQHQKTRKRQAPCPLCKSLFKVRREWHFKECMPLKQLIELLKPHEQPFELDLAAVPVEDLERLI